MNIKRRFKIICILLILVLGLYLSCNELEIQIYPDAFAAKTDQSSTSTKNPTDQSSTDNEADMIELLARVINGEARGEPYKGQVAVGAVIMNRVESSEFPNTISGVIYQANQFSCVMDGQINKAIDPNSTVYKAAREAYNGADPTNGALFFFNPSIIKSSWLYSRKAVATIGSHRFTL